MDLKEPDTPLDDPRAIDRIRRSTIGRSIFRSPDRVTERDQAAGHWSNFLLHIYPVKVRRKELTFRYSAFLGVASVVLFGSLVASGIYSDVLLRPVPSLGVRQHSGDPNARWPSANTSATCTGGRPT